MGLLHRKTRSGGVAKPEAALRKLTLGYVLRRDFTYNKYVYLMAVPVIAFYIIFHYVPMYGAIIAFKNYSVTRGILQSPWTGFTHFKYFFTSYYFWRVLRNTILINLYVLIFSFPAPIILALLLNEIRNMAFKRSVQTISYLPHFISMVVVCGMIIDFTAREGLINDMLDLVGLDRIPFMALPQWFRPVYVLSGIWHGIGWGSIIYLAAITGIDPELYQAAEMDGAKRFSKIWHITIPGIMPTVVILFILRIGGMMSIGVQKILLLYNPLTYETADVISTFVYRKGLLEMDFSYATAVGLFQAVMNFILLVLANRISRKVSEMSLW